MKTTTSGLRRSDTMNGYAYGNKQNDNEKRATLIFSNAYAKTAASETVEISNLFYIQPSKKKADAVAGIDMERYEEKLSNIQSNTDFIEDLKRLGCAGAEDVAHFERLIRLDTLELAVSN